MSKIEFLDTTLRDGAQAVGINFSQCDRASIFKLLDGFGISLIESGVANPKDREFFKAVSSERLVAFSATRHRDKNVQNDEALNDVLDANTSTVCVFGKADGRQAKRVLGVSTDENLNIIADSVRYLRSNGRRVIFDAEHFFDGYLYDAAYALKVLEVAVQAGADTVVLCDTNGGTMPWQIYDAVKEAVAFLPKDIRVGIHAHDDCGMAVACSLMAVQAGATHVQGTFLGFGERCGNASLCTVIANLQLKMHVDCGCDLKKLTSTAHSIAEIANIGLQSSMPYVGAFAFAHKAGMHVDAVLKDEHSFEHISPASVGNEHRLILSEVSGRSAVSYKLQELIPDVDRLSPQTKQILDKIKQLEKDGFQFDTADGSFSLLAKRLLGTYTPSFELVGYDIKESQPDGISAAEVSIKVGDTVTSAKRNGNGPVNALDAALRDALTRCYPQIASITLSDYKVRVLDFASATGAMVRVLITSTDGKDSWTTVGVSTDVIEASWIALKDSFEYKLNGGGRA